MFHSVLNPQASFVTDAARVVLMVNNLVIVKADLLGCRALDGEERTCRR
jgi:hypothetical protein